MSFRAHEKVAVEIVAKASADVTHEVIAADEVRATDCPASGESLVEAQALPTDASHHFSRSMLAQFGSVDSVEIIEQWTVGLESAIQILTSAPGQFTADSELLFQQKIRADDRVSASGERNRGMISRGARRRGRSQSAYTESDVKLLRMKRAADQKTSCQYHE